MSDGNNPITSSYITTTESTLGGEIKRMLEADEMLIGDGPSYELAKSCFLYHPLGRKMAEGPVALAQSQKRRITVGDAPPEVAKQFETEWKRLRSDKHIANVARLARIYGISTLIIGVGENEDADKALDPAALADKDVWFSALDPLNTAGSLVLSQIPTSPNFNKPVTVRTNGKVFHPSRFVVVMNEEPIYLAYTNAAFGFVGRSVYQRALFPMKSYLRSMIANDMIQSKLGMIVAKLVSPSPMVTKEMGLLAALKRAFIKQAKTGNVLTIGTTEGIETLNMQNVDGAGSAPLVLPGGGALVAGQIVAGGMYTAIYDGTNFQIPEIPTNLNTLYQQIINAVYPIGGYAFWENDSLNPNTVFTFQTWVEVTGYVLVGRQTSTPQFATTGQTGGEITHQLVVTEVPPLPYQDAYYSEGSSSSGGRRGGNPQPGDLWMNLGGLNHSVGSAMTDYDNAGSYYRNANTQSGSNGVAVGHNNLQPYRVVRMWRRTA